MVNRPFAQLLPGLETGHTVTVGQSPAYDFSVSDEQKAVFFCPFRTVLCAIHMQVTDRPSPDAPSLTQAIIVQMVHFKVQKHLAKVVWSVFVRGRDIETSIRFWRLLTVFDGSMVDLI